MNMSEAFLAAQVEVDDRLAIAAHVLGAADWAPSLADPEAFRAAVEGLGLTVNSAGAKLGADERTVRRYASRDPRAHRAPPRTLEILIGVMTSLK